MKLEFDLQGAVQEQPLWRDPKRTGQTEELDQLGFVRQQDHRKNSQVTFQAQLTKIHVRIIQLIPSKQSTLQYQGFFSPWAISLLTWLGIRFSKRM
jgi:hypothetical protein